MHNLFCHGFWLIASEQPSLRGRLKCQAVIRVRPSALAVGSTLLVEYSEHLRTDAIRCSHVEEFIIERADDELVVARERTSKQVESLAAWVSNSGGWNGGSIRVDDR